MPYKDEILQKAAQKRYYEENKHKYRARSRQRNNTLRRRIIEIKESTPCTDCGIQYPHYTMDFDHVRGEKRCNVSEVSKLTPKTFEEEVAKCEVVCANCHRHRTWMRLSKNGDGAIS
jgi:hypothetical protein